MYTLAEAQKLFENHLKNIKFPETPSELYDPVQYILSTGGKRIRPALVLLACDMFGGSVASALHPAVAIEMFHNFTLLHDDIMDQSEMRRGIDTVHVKWNENIAILSGDVMSILASRFINESPGAVLRNVHDVFTLTAMDVCEGQQMDMNFESELFVEEDEYLKMIELKTAVLIAASLKIGAMLGGAAEKDAEDLYKFGRDLGIAFQLQDDLLDTFGDPKVFGKKPGMDIVGNKKTILMITALKDADEVEKKQLTHWLTVEDFDAEEKVTQVVDIFNKLDVRSKVEKKINAYYKTSLINLEALNSPKDRKSELFEFAANLMERQK
ncbi:MAG: polyprenyl synthetase family protein [Bacteroidales bacterium]|jgi:geranylgeranyl diphosphate synthase type II|nr:polyprenyl synthetase family protein [Bacteroidales bacterium]